MPDSQTKPELLSDETLTRIERESYAASLHDVRALCQTVRALRAENERLKGEWLERQPIMTSGVTTTVTIKNNEKRAERIAAKFTEKFCKAAPLAASGEFNTGLKASILSALDSSNTALREQLAEAQNMIDAANRYQASARARIDDLESQLAQVENERQELEQQ